MKLICDAGALVALERGDMAMWERLKMARIRGTRAVTHGGVIGQVWRGGSGRQVLLARALGWIEVLPLDERLGRAAGDLLGRCGRSDAIDAAVVALAASGDLIATSDSLDIGLLVAASGRPIDVVPV